jgi:hypothetical protein
MTDASLPTTALFLATTAGVAGLFWAATGRSFRALAVLGVWMAVTGVLAARGVLSDFSLPPKMLGVLAVSLIGAIVLTASPLGRRMALVPSIAWLVGFQVFRIPVEIVLFRLHQEGIVPVQMTFEGMNFDIFTGITAIPVAYFASRDRLPTPVLAIWNVVGLAFLVNIVAIAVLSMPLPFRAFTSGPANTFITTVPYIWLATVLVPAALVGHLLVFRRILATRPKAQPAKLAEAMA